ncbi:hypothetical protein C2857_001917 [Epichloe festucae Fl1]|uniref:AAA+ ATPase domain-containing protein n=1 Tax=Epichloe festucae (strain Fl1) TaxID=877507 RepID=A0A7S9KUE5_EPIFF|nr:hypothetical protein C2857_001917 [Epichloe festucae Fl1]
MESSRVGGTAAERQIHSSQQITETVAENDDGSTKKSNCHTKSSEPSKTKPDTPDRSTAKSKKTKNSRKAGDSGRKGRFEKTSRNHCLRRMKGPPSSSSELYSPSESDGSSSTDTDDGDTLYSSDEDEIHRKRKSRMSRASSRSVSRHRVHDGRNALRGPSKAVRGSGSTVMPRKEAGSRNAHGLDNWVDATAQKDIGEALEQLELRCSHLQHQLDTMSGFQASQTNRQFQSQQQPVIGAFGNPYSTTDLAQTESTSITQVNNKNQTPFVSRYSRPVVLPTRESSTRPISPGPLAGSRGNPLGNGKSDSHHDAQREKKLDYKRVDAVWDSKLFAFKLQDTADMAANSKYGGYLFHVRRTFSSDGKYRATSVDIKSKLLRECLQDVIGNVRGVNLVDETPKLDPNLLFLYLDDFRSYLKKLKEVEPAGKHKREQRRNQRRLDNKRKELKVLIKYLDKDYAKVKKSLYSMLDSGIVNFEYFWALWKPNTLVYSATYGHMEDPRVFKVDMAVRHSSMFRGNCYVVDGKYLEFDGKRFGHGSVVEEIAEFQGTRKITSLPFYPLSYHKDELNMRQTLIERGKKFVSLNGAYFKAYSGLAYMKGKKGAITKFHIQPSRIMVDPAIFRRINPNYFVSAVRPKGSDALSDSGLSDGEDDMYDCFSSEDVHGEEGPKVTSKTTKGFDRSILVTKALQADLVARSKPSPLQSLPTTASATIQGANSTDSSTEEKVAETPKGDSVTDQSLVFTDDDYLLASPVVLGFSFSEKEWLEFSVSRIREIKWNEDAWGSLVLPPETKDLIQALVKSRKNNLTQTIDDVIQGKGKGLVTVLHGPPGTGKTLTAEGISELLQCPLYMVSAGELGTNSRFLEMELQKILDICHSWGAILLLDEADVFLEKRNMQDIHRNALVSIFLRQLEYFQGILFLTTNRVETFDEAFQSRIHIALRYDGLDSKAKKAILKMFIGRVEAHGQLAVEPFTDEDLDQLAKHELNGREIKNMIGSAQDLALNKAEALSMRHMQQVLDIHAKFGRDLRGGTGYEDAMRSYC